LKRPPARTGTSKPQPKANPKPQVVSKPRAEKVKAPKPARSKVTSIRPKVSFGKQVRVIIIGSLSVLVVIVLVMVFSPILAVKSIEITGVNRVSEASIRKDLKFLIGKPLPQVTSDEIATKLSSYQLIDSVSAVSVPPNTLRVVVIERSPIAILAINGVPYLYDPAGVQLGRAGVKDRLPTIQNVGNPATSKTFKLAIDVLLMIPVKLLPQVATISASSKDSVYLTLRSKNQKILWGDDSQPGLKAKVLSALMDHYARQWGITFDVSSPGQPSVY
jgi:cell division protein FtsQ